MERLRHQNSLRVRHAPTIERRALGCWCYSVAWNEYFRKGSEYHITWPLPTGWVWRCISRHGTPSSATIYPLRTPQCWVECWMGRIFSLTSPCLHTPHLLFVKKRKGEEGREMCKMLQFYTCKDFVNLCRVLNCRQDHRFIKFKEGKDCIKCSNQVRVPLSWNSISANFRCRAEFLVKFTMPPNLLILYDHSKITCSTVIIPSCREHQKKRIKICQFSSWKNKGWN